MRNGGQIKVSGLILAAGEGKRFGGPKALAKYRHETFLEIIVGNLWGAADYITVVGGAEYEQVKMESDRLGIPILKNHYWSEGQFTSLKTGLQSITDDFDCVMIALVDHPFVKKETYQALRNQYIGYPGKIIIPISSGRRGHPIVIPISLKSTILNNSNNANLREILREFASDVMDFPVDDDGILKDIDTRQNLEGIKWG